MQNKQLNFIICLSLSTAVSDAQQLWLPNNSAGDETKRPSSITRPTGVKDQQAVDLIAKVLSVAGGDAAAKVQNFTASGNVTEHNSAGTDQGAIVIRGHGLNVLRTDSSFPSGVRSEIYNRQVTQKDEKGAVTTIHGQSTLAATKLILPYTELAIALRSNAISLAYKGFAEVDGRPTLNVQVQHLLPNAANPDSANPKTLSSPGDDLRHLLEERLKIDFFIDPATFQVVMIQDFSVLRKQPHQTRFSNYQVVGGVLVPFSISESIFGRQTRAIQLDKFDLTPTLQESDFQF